jgi:hypothetical protein
MTDECAGTPGRLDAWIDRRRTEGWAPEADLMDARLSEADALRLGRVLRALADAGLIDDCHLFVPPVGPGSIESVRR